VRHRVPSGSERAIQQETVSVHDTVSLRKLQSLGKCHNENMSTVACLAIILAFVTEDETVYRKRKRSIWTKDWLKRRSVFGQGNLINDEMVTWYNSSQICQYTLQTATQPTVAQQNSNLFDNRQTVAQTVKPHHTRSTSLLNSLCNAN